MFPFRLQVGSCSFRDLYSRRSSKSQIDPGCGRSDAELRGSSITIPAVHFGAPIFKVTVSVGIFHGNVSTLKLTRDRARWPGVVRGNQGRQRRETIRTVPDQNPHAFTPACPRHLV